MKKRHHALWIGTLAILAAAVAGQLASDRNQRGLIAEALGRGHASRAPELIRRYGCGGCHTIDRIPGADGKVGPPLTDLRARLYVGGSRLNSGDALVRFIVAPDESAPHTAMPRTGISEPEARDVVTYLYAQ
jgi:cytochrome c2